MKAWLLCRPLLLQLSLCIGATAVSAARPTAWNFAFGSNLNRATRERRGLQPLQRIPGQVDGWELAFSLGGLPYVEPAFAALRPAPVGSTVSVHGLCLELDAEGWIRLLSSEGVLRPDRAEALRRRQASVDDVLDAAQQEEKVPGGGYRLKEVEVTAYGATLTGPQPRLCYTLADGSEETGPTPRLVPSERYWRLMRNGAATEGLAVDYRDFIAALPRYSPSPLAIAALPSILAPALFAAVSAVLVGGTTSSLRQLRQQAWPTLRGTARSFAKGTLIQGRPIDPKVWARYCSTPREELLDIVLRLAREDELA